MEKSITLEVLGVAVTSEIVRDEEIANPDGGMQRYIVIRSSCDSKRWGKRSADFHHSSPPGLDSFETSLIGARRTAAEALVKQELGIVTDHSTPVLGIKLVGPTGKTINTIASIDLGIAPTRISSHLIECLQLLPSGGTHWEKVGNQWVQIPLLAGKIQFGVQEHEVQVLPTQMGFPCVIGTGYLRSAITDVELVQELLLSAHRRAIANVARCKKNYVLITGKYGDHRIRLERVKQVVESIGFSGVILDAEPDIEEQSLAEKMVLYAAISRFVIVDDFAPSGHISELEICSERRFTTAVLRKAGIGATAMQADIADDVQFMRVFEYTDESNLEGTVVEAAKWANQTVADRAQNLNRKYQWRTPYAGVVRVKE